MAEVKRCGAPKFGIVCDAILAENNKSGFCSKHFYYSKKDPKDYQHLRKADASPKGNAAQQSNGAPHTPGDHNGDGRRDVARHVSLSTSPNLPPVAITNNGNGNGNGHGKIASDGAYLVPCQVSEWAMDRIWLKLMPEEKAELLFRPPEAPQKEQQEPAHHA